MESLTPPATIEGVLAAATAAEAEPNPTGTKLAVGAMEAKGTAPKEDKTTPNPEECTSLLYLVGKRVTIPQQQEQRTTMRRIIICKL